MEEQRGRERRCGGQAASGRDREGVHEERGERETLSRTARLQSERPCKSASTASKNLRSCKSAKRDIVSAKQTYYQPQKESYLLSASKRDLLLLTISLKKRPIISLLFAY
jgi:hypothetical protein